MGARVWMSLILAVSSASAQAAAAASVTWQLADVAFADGATATGSFAYDPALHVTSDWNISVSGGDTATFPPLVYDASSLDHHSEVGTLPALQIFYFEIGMGASERILALAALEDLGTASGTVALEVGFASHSYECINCSPYRFITAGTLVPEPSSAIACAVAACFSLGAISLARRSRRRAVAVAQRDRIAWRRRIGAGDDCSSRPSRLALDHERADRAGVPAATGSIFQISRA